MTGYTVAGIFDGLCSGACLVKDGAVVKAVSEERYNNIKNFTGMPIRSIEWILEDSPPLDAVALSTRFVHSPSFFKDFSWMKRGSKEHLRNQLSWWFSKRYNPYYSQRTNTRVKNLRAILDNLGVSFKVPISVVDHHQAHAASAYYSSGLENPVIVTADGSGDGLSASVSLVDEDGLVKRIASKSRDESIGEVYAVSTYILGFKPLEHEYKLMGMAPYNRPDDDIVFGLRRLAHTSSTKFIYPELMKLYQGKRLDVVCASLQIWFEAEMIEWVNNINKSVQGDGSWCFSGGDYMNVKANMLIQNLPYVKRAFFMPSASDESTCIGAAQHVYAYLQRYHGEKVKLQPIDNLYLGPEAVLPEDSSDFNVFKNRRTDEEAAHLIAEGEIVARCSGRMEFGARALGNRSILADPRDMTVIDRLNKAIKNRCYDDETEILTSNGWKFFKYLEGKELVATLNPTTNKLEYQPIIEIINEQYDGELCTFENRRINLHVTPNHKIWYKKRDDEENKYQFGIAENLTQGHIQRKGGVDWDGKEESIFELCDVEDFDSPKPIEIPMDIWLEFLGYWVAEGHTHNDKLGHYIIGVSQKYNTDKYKKIEACLKKMPFHLNPSYCNKTNMMCQRFYNKQLYQYLAKLGKSRNKYIPREFLELSKRQLRILFDALILGDGNIRGKQFRYVTNSKQLADDVQEIALKLGYSSIISRQGGKGFSTNIGYCVRIGLSPVSWVTKDCISRREYHGKVYCVSVKNHHVLYVRRYGKPVFSGNSFWMPFTPSMLYEDANKYIVNPHSIYAPYMITCFDSTDEGKRKIPAAMHRFDYTVRPHMVKKDWNPEYHRLISHFRDLTGVSAVLNTSFNLHGYPIVLDAERALWVMRNSNLKYLIIGDNMVVKR